MGKRILSVILAVVVMITSVDVSVFASEVRGKRFRLRQRQRLM